jgi:hypothetical protein
MIFDFIDIAYSYTILVFIIISLLVEKTRKRYVKNFIAVSNVLLICYSWYLLFQFYKLIQFTSSLNIKVEKGSEFKLMLGWFEIRFLLLVFLPYLFLFKKLMANKIFSIVMFAIIQWSFIQSCYTSLNKSDTLPLIIYYLPYNISFKILNYISLFTAVYALLWMLKKLPSQQEKSSCIHHCN